MAHLSARDITVIEYQKDRPDTAMLDHPAGRRYRTLFGDEISWHACGLDAWLTRETQR